MRSLSLKIFLWFWLAILVSGLAILCVAAFYPSQTFVVQATNYFMYNLSTTGRLGADMHERGDPKALDDLLSNIETISSFRLYLVDDHGKPLRASRLPAGAKELALETVTGDSPQFKNLFSHPLIAVKATSGSGRDYVAMLELPIGVVRYFITLSKGHLSRLLAALLASAMVCFLLTRYLTAPIKKLQTAVQRFARGDLSVRVGPQIGNRKDEIANLGRDFDVMAMQIETLMNAHERLLRDVAHELRSPLTRLNVALEIAKKHAGDEAERFLLRIGRETEKLNRLITQLLTLSRMENTDMAVQMRPVALEKIISRIAQDAGFEGLARECMVAFHCQDKCTLPADGNLVRSAIENVVRNALRFTPAGSRVEIAQRVVADDSGGRMVEVTVSDTGPGVADDALETIFQPFYRAVDQPPRASGGAGLGLAIAHRAVSMHKGRIIAKNRPQGGLAVEIRLPF